MKKLFLLSVLAAGSISFANGQSASDWGIQIGQTYYDLQSNGASGNRILRLPDGRIAATWTEACLSSPGSCDPDAGAPPGSCTYPDRGAGYNVITPGATPTSTFGADGTCNETGSANGIFPGRVGWPEIIITGDGKEIVFAHTPLQYMWRNTPGTGGMSTWTHVANPFPGSFANTWPRAVASGSYIHMIATCSGCVDPVTAVEAPIRYFRSSDNGATWDKIDAQLPGLDTASYPEGIGADAYAIHANGPHVAIIAGDGGSDWSMWKSSDNGDNWTKTTIRHFAGAADTVDILGDADNVQYITNDRFQSVVVKANGEAHAFAGESVVVVDRVSMQTTGFYYPGLSQGLWHWSTAMMGQEPQYIVTELEDLTPNDDTDSTLAAETIGNYQSGTIGMPSAAVDADGDVIVVYSAVVTGTNDEGNWDTGQNYRNLYAARLREGHAWGTPINMATAYAGGLNEFEESVFPSVVKNIAADDVLHLIYQNDDEPGLHIQADYDPEQLARIYYAGVDANMIPAGPTGIKDDNNTISGLTVSPNPTSSIATVKLDLAKDVKVGVKVFNVLGQEVVNIPVTNYTTPVEVNLAGQPAGIYILSVNVDGVATTQRLVKQ